MSRVGESKRPNQNIDKSKNPLLPSSNPSKRKKTHRGGWCGNSKKMVNEEILSPLPLLYLCLHIIIVTKTTICPSLTLKLLYSFNPSRTLHSFLLLYENPYILLHSHLVYLPSTLLFFLFLSTLFSFFLFCLFSLLFRGFLDFFCSALSTR